MKYQLAAVDADFLDSAKKTTKRPPHHSAVAAGVTTVFERIWLALIFHH